MTDDHAHLPTRFLMKDHGPGDDHTRVTSPTADLSNLQTVHSELRPRDLQSSQDGWQNWVQMDASWGEFSNDGIPLRLLINFSKHRLPLARGIVEFGFKAGELCIETTNAHLPLKFRRPIVKFPESVTRTYKETTSASKADPFTKVDVGLEKGIPTAKFGAESNHSSHAETQETSFSRTDWQIVPTGPAEKPIWAFEVLEKGGYLVGQWEEEIGSVVMSGTTCSLVGHFTSEPRHLRILEIHGIGARLSHEIVKALELWIYRRLCNESLCRFELSYAKE